MDGAPYSVSLEDDQGNTLRAFRRTGTTFVLGYEGERYEVRLENHSDRRVEAVLSVDGRDAVSGAVGDYAHQRGYVVPAHGSVVIDGFRQNLEHTAAFRFSRPGASYSARMGTPENVGVIGVAFFSERTVARPLAVPHPTFDERRTRDDAPTHGGEDRYAGRRTYDKYEESRGGNAEGASRAAPTASAPAGPLTSESATPSPPQYKYKAGAPADAARARRWRDSSGDADMGESAQNAPSRLGTEYGESTWSPVTEVAFQRRDPARPDVVATLRYDDADGLSARGIDVYPHDYWPSAQATPEAFPRNRFAPPPPLP